MKHSYKFSKGAISFKIVRYFGLFPLFLWICLLILELYLDEMPNYTYPVASLLCTLPIFSILTLFNYAIWFKQVNEIEFDFEKNRITAKPYFLKGPIEYSLDDLDSVILQYSIVFIFKDGKRIWWLDREYKLLSFFEEKKIDYKWGLWGKFFKTFIFSFD